MRGVLDKEILRSYDELRGLVSDETLLTRTHVRITFTSAKRRRDLLRQIAAADEDMFETMRGWDYRSDCLRDKDRRAFPDDEFEFEYPIVFPRAQLPAVVKCLRETAAAPAVDGLR